MSSVKWCSYCDSKGHRKRQCTKLRRDAAEGNHWARWIIEDWARSVERRKEKIKNGEFFCSYCEAKGHRRSKCDLLKTDREWFLREVNLLREEQHEVLSSLGLGAGATGTLFYKSAYRERICPFVSLGWDWNSIHMLKRNFSNSWIILNVFLPLEGIRSQVEVENCGNTHKPEYRLSRQNHLLPKGKSKGYYGISVSQSRDLKPSKEEIILGEKSPLTKAIFSRKRTPRDWGVAFYYYNKDPKDYGRTFKHERFDAYRQWYERNRPRT
jgi:hypothetical protein